MKTLTRGLLAACLFAVLTLPCAAQAKKRAPMKTTPPPGSKQTQPTQNPGGGMYQPGYNPYNPQQPTYPYFAPQQPQRPSQNARNNNYLAEFAANRATLDALTRINSNSPFAAQMAPYAQYSPFTANNYNPYQMNQFNPYQMNQFNPYQSNPFNPYQSNPFATTNPFQQQYNPYQQIAPFNPWGQQVNPFQQNPFRYNPAMFPGIGIFGG